MIRSAGAPDIAAGLAANVEVFDAALLPFPLPATPALAGLQLAAQ